jgi:hypothetical protein
MSWAAAAAAIIFGSVFAYYSLLFREFPERFPDGSPKNRKNEKKYINDRIIYIAFCVLLDTFRTYCSPAHTVQCAHIAP